VAESLRCYHCGKHLIAVAQFNNVQMAGISLVGNCPDCDRRQHIGKLWKVVERIDESDNGNAKTTNK
jgi:phage FluMu protein Com